MLEDGLVRRLRAAGFYLRKLGGHTVVSKLSATCEIPRSWARNVLINCIVGDLADREDENYCCFLCGLVSAKRGVELRMVRVTVGGARLARHGRLVAGAASSGVMPLGAPLLLSKQILCN